MTRFSVVTTGPAATANEAIASADGEFVALVEPSDHLDRRALVRIDDALRADPAIDVLYTDEDVADGDGTAVETFHKPDWSPERLRSQDYCGGLTVVRRSLLEQVGGLRDGFDSAQHHDVVLRVTEGARRIHHVPEVLYHRRRPTPQRGDGHRRAVAEHVARVGIAADVEPLGNGLVRVRRRRASPPPGVSVVIPTAGTVRPVWGVDRVLVLQTIRSLLDRTVFPDIEVVVVVDPVTPEDTRRALAALDVVVIDGVGPFNFSARCNQGVAASTGEVVALLNDDVLVEQPDWLDVMVGFLAETDVGVVGARLLFADGTLQHGGVLLNEQPLHIFHGFAGDDPGPFGLLQVDREVSVVTGACFVTPRHVWDELGGLPDDFAVAFNDLDYCLRARATGRRVIWTPHATLYHFESQTRLPYAEQHEIDLLYDRWTPELQHDPYGNPGFEPRQATWLPRDRPTLGTVARRAARSVHHRFNGG